MFKPTRIEKYLGADRGVTSDGDVVKGVLPGGQAALVDRYGTAHGKVPATPPIPPGKPKKKTYAAPAIRYGYVLINQWGGNGSGDGEFLVPQGIAIDSNNNVYVVDVTRDDVQKFDDEGNFILKWGSTGSGDGEFLLPNTIAVDSEDNIYITDRGTGRDDVQKFDDEGNFILKWGGNGSGDGEFQDPQGIAIDSGDNVYVTDVARDDVQKFDDEGNFILKWGSTGSGDGEFLLPRGIIIDSESNISICDSGRGDVQKFDDEGNFILKWGVQGGGEGEFLTLIGVVIDANGNFIISGFPQIMQTFTADGVFLDQWGETELTNITSIAINSHGLVYANAFVEDMIKVFRYQRI